MESDIESMHGVQQTIWLGMMMLLNAMAICYVVMQAMPRT